MADKLTMWRLDMTGYEVTVETPDGPSKGTFDVKGSLEQMLFNTRLQLEIPEAFKALDLIERIKAAEVHILLDKDDHARLMRAYGALRAPHINAMELLRRIRDAERVEVEATVP